MVVPPARINDYAPARPVRTSARASQGAVELADFRQGPELWATVTAAKFTYDKNKGRWNAEDRTEVLPVRPDAFISLHFPNAPESERTWHFFYEADRQRTACPKFAKKLRALYAYVVTQKKHLQHYGVNRIRAVLIETIDRDWAKKLYQTALQPIVTGTDKLPALFWFTASPFLTPTSVLQDIWECPALDKPQSLAPFRTAGIDSAVIPPATLDDLELTVSAGAGAKISRDVGL